MVGSLLTPDEVQELGLTNEPALCEAHSIRFLEFPIVDRGVPASQPEATSFIRTLREALEMGRSVAIHCRQGIGRSSLIAAGLLVTSGSDPSEAFHRVSDARGLPVPETSDQVEWVTQLSAIPRSP